MTDNALIKAEDINALEIFVTGKYQIILDSIEKKATIENPSVENKKDRDLIKSTAAKVASSKVLLETVGKNLADEKRKLIESELNSINGARNAIKTFLVDLKDKVRKPLTEWEDEIKAAEAEGQRKIDYDNYHIQGLDENRLVDERRAIEVEKARLAKEEEKREIEEQSRINAEKKVEDQRMEGLRREREAQTKLEQAEIDKKIAEENRIKDKKQALINQEVAVLAAEKKVKEESDRKERERLQKEESDRKEREARAADETHRKQINNESLSDLITLGHPEELAKKIIISIIQGKVRNVSINY